MTHFHWKHVLAGAALSLATGLAMAGQSCGAAAQGPSPDVTAKAIQSASATVTRLNKGSDSVVLIARMGQDLTEYGLTYSHLAYAVKKDDGTWVVVHKLNGCGTAKADIFEQSMDQFYMDDLYKYQAGVWQLNPEIQARLRPVLLGKGSLAFHESSYNMLAYPFSLKHQNSNGWVLEVLTQAIDPSIKNRAQAVAWLQDIDFQPSVLNIGAMKRLGARATKANITFDDQPSKERWAGRVQTVTVDAVITFMQNVRGLCQQKNCKEERIENN